MSERAYLRLEYAGQRVSVEDSTLVCYCRDRGGLTIDVMLWDEREAQLRIERVVGVAEVLAGDLSSIVARDVSSQDVSLVADEFVSSSIHECYGRSGGELALIEFVDPEDRVALRVTAAARERVKVVRVSERHG